MELELTNIVTVSVSEAQQGLGDYNVSNIGLFTRESYDAGTFGDDGYKIYLSPQEVATDFGTDSDTYRMAVSIFSQKPNILAGDGALIVIPFVDTDAVTAVQTVTPSEAPASGNYKLNWEGDVTGSIAWDADAATIQTAVQTITGLETATVTGTLATHLTVTFTGVSGPAALLTVTDDSLQTAEPENVSLTVVTTVPGTVFSTEDINSAIVRTQDLVQYFGVIAAEVTSEADMLEAAATIQTLNKIAFFMSRTEADVEPDGMLDKLAQNGYTQSRGLFYGGDSEAVLQMAAAYAGRALSTAFDASNTTQTMHLKDLTGISADDTMTQTLLDKCQAAGVDVYASFQGVAKTFTSGINGFFDQVYNLQWFVGALQVAGFNALATVGTKVPQTENGMQILKGAYRKVCEQAVTNQYSAPGEWTRPDTFGNLADFLQNIRERGYYIYSAPISQQSQTAREDREAPIIQIALKEAGAIHKTDVIVNINA